MLELSLLIIFCAALVRSAIGFGDALLAMPLLMLTIGVQTATPVMAMLAVCFSLGILLTTWRSVHIGKVFWLLAGAAAGIPLGIYLLKHVNEDYLRLLLAGMIFLFLMTRVTNTRLTRMRLSGHPVQAIAFGVVSGIFGGAFNTNGPAVVIYAQLCGWPKERFRGMMQSYFLPTNLMVTIGHWQAGLWTSEVMRLFYWSLPVVVAALFVGDWLSKRLNHRTFEQMIVMLLFVACGALVYSVIW